MSSSSLQCIVTGANRGIGFAITRRLGNAGHRVLLACRTRTSAEDAISRLVREDGLSDSLLEPFVLDLADPESIRSFVSTLTEQHPEGVDVLVNNAGVIKDERPPSLSDAEAVLRVNYFGTKELTLQLLPLLMQGSQLKRIVSVSSQAIRFCTGAWEEGLKHSILHSESIESLDAKCQSYLEDIRRVEESGSKDPIAKYGGVHEFLSYTVAKAAVMGMANILHCKAVAEATELCSVAVCPGWCKTDMGGSNAQFSADQGSDTPAWLATEGLRDVHGGKFWQHRVELDVDGEGQW